MKIPRDLSATDLIKILNRFGYEVTRQKGSHIRLSNVVNGLTHNVTVPNHNPIKLGTLASILKDVSEFLKISKDDIFK